MEAFLYVHVNVWRNIFFILNYYLSVKVQPRKVFFLATAVGYFVSDQGGRLDAIALLHSHPPDKCCRFAR